MPASPCEKRRDGYEDSSPTSKERSLTRGWRGVGLWNTVSYHDFARESRDTPGQLSEEKPQSTITVAKYTECSGAAGLEGTTSSKSSKLPPSNDIRSASLVLLGHERDTLKMVLHPSTCSSQISLVVEVSRRHRSVDVTTSLQCGSSPWK